MRLPPWVKDTRNQGICAALVIVLIFVLYIAHRAPQSPVATPDNLLVIPSSALTASTAVSATTSAATTTPKVIAKKILANTPLEAAALVATPVSATSAQQLTTSGGQLLKSLVNIVCVSGDRSIPSICFHQLPSASMIVTVGLQPCRRSTITSPAASSDRSAR